MKVRIEIVDDGGEEIIIRCRERDERIDEIEQALDAALRSSGELALYINGTEYFVPRSEILYFESEGDRIFAGTKSHRYVTTFKLFELEDMMPSYFVRISKSTIANVKLISSLKREVTGNGELTFKGSEKKVYFSRSYYKKLRAKIDEVRLGK